MTTIDLAGRAGSYRPPRQGRYTPTAPMRKATAASLRKLAGHMESRHPDLGAHEHITDAARALDRGQTDAANRHLTAAIGNLTPQSLRRHGLLADDQHDAAKRSMDAVHRHMLLIKDIADLHQQNTQLPYRDDPREDPGIADDNLSDKPVPRQPGGAKGLNAPARTNSGGPDPAVAKPQQATGSSAKQVAASVSGDLTVSIELAEHAPYRYRHGWIRISPGAADAVRATAAKADSGHDPASAQAGLHLRQAAAIMDQGELSERAHEDARTHLSQAASYRPDLEGEITGHVRGLDSSARADDAPPPRAPGGRAVKSSDTPLGTSLGKLNLFGRVLPSANRILASVTWDDVAGQVVELSAQTGALATVPHPFGKPGGPGLWGVKGMELPPYVQNIAHALLREGRAKDEGQAIAMARAATKRWLHGKNVHPEVRAASAGADADWRAKQARAHAHANGLTALELTGTAAGASKDQRSAVTGQYVTAGSGSGASGGKQPPAKGGGQHGGKPPVKGQPPAKGGHKAPPKPPAKGGKQPPAKKGPDAHQQHVAHEKAQIAGQIRANNGKISTLEAQKRSMLAALASASGKTSSGQSGSKTSSNATTKSSAAATTASTAASTASSAASTAKSAASSASGSGSQATAQISAAIAGINSQIGALQAANAKLAKQSAQLHSNTRPALEFVGPKGYTHGWHYVGGPGLPSPSSAKGPDRRGDALRKRGFSETDVHVMRSGEARAAMETRREMPAKPGTPEHAQELRGLADEADQTQQDNYAMTRLHPGSASYQDLRYFSGKTPVQYPRSETAATLRRAADMIDKGQPSLARAHARAIKEAAANERAAGNLRPDYARRLSQAADKLRQLPMNQGLSRNPAESASAARRTLQARAYASRSIQA